MACASQPHMELAVTTVPENRVSAESSVITGALLVSGQLSDANPQPVPDGVHASLLRLLSFGFVCFD